MVLSVFRAAGALLLRLPRAGASVPILAWAGLIVWLGSWTADGAADLSGTTFLANLGHAPLYGLLALWFALALPRGIDRRSAPASVRRNGWPRIDQRPAAGVLALVAASGVADEWHQHALGRGRDLSLLDVGTDLVGAACVLAVIAYLERDRASDRGLVARLALGVAACAAAAAVATWLPPVFPDAAWL